MNAKDLNDGTLNKETILDVTEKVIRHYGYGKASLSDVSRELKISHAAIYRYFDNKKSLWNAVAERWLTRISRDLLSIVNESNIEDDKLKQWLLALFRLKKEYADKDPEMFLIYSQLSLESGEVLEKHLATIENHLILILQEGIDEGKYQNIDLNVTANAILVAMSKFHNPSLAHEWNQEYIDQQFENVYSLVLKAIIKN